ARTLVDAGAAIMVRDHHATAEQIGARLEEVLFDPARLEAMRKAALSVARPQAAAELAEWVLELALVP
ncbi:MAG: hypothetical protein ACREJP_05070, partial [Candidatus Methylomirabilales bacterium]